ncbi:hypothetical protein ALC60_00771 [Trachymyrmex zeteki]|uniref:Uncharacterized protein n=1 Tax=Mycetomoellerius zeteki TaxID=64791 RepID=A0A151XIX5_9HYME|nr:hypothetical protein ALC60_00771 [Trachymyrmex zeteki]
MKESAKGSGGRCDGSRNRCQPGVPDCKEKKGMRELWLSLVSVPPPKANNGPIFAPSAPAIFTSTSRSSLLPLRLSLLPICKRVADGHHHHPADPPPICIYRHYIGGQISRMPATFFQTPILVPDSPSLRMQPPVNHTLPRDIPITNSTPTRSVSPDFGNTRIVPLFTKISMKITVGGFSLVNGQPIVHALISEGELPSPTIVTVHSREMPMEHDLPSKKTTMRLPSSSSSSSNLA